MLQRMTQQRLQSLYIMLVWINVSQRDRSITKDGKGWTLAMFCTALKSLLTELKQCYNTHRFQIGAAISASLSNMPDTHIQLLSCWQSNVFKHYIRPPPSQVAKFSKALVLGNH